MELSSTPEVPLCPFQWLHCVNTPRMAHPLHRRGAFEQPPIGGYCGQCCREHLGACLGGGHTDVFLGGMELLGR